MALSQSLMAALGFCILMKTLTQRTRLPSLRVVTNEQLWDKRHAGSSPRPLGVKDRYAGVQFDGFSEKIQSFLQVAWRRKKWGIKGDSFLVRGVLLNFITGYGLCLSTFSKSINGLNLLLVGLIHHLFCDLNKRIMFYYSLSGKPSVCELQPEWQKQ